MSGLFDNASIDIPCSECGHKTPKTIGWIKRHNNFACTCGTNITLDGDDFRRELAKVEKSLAKAMTAFKGIGK